MGSPQGQCHCCGSLLLIDTTPAHAIGLLAMAASLLGFLVFNFHPAKISWATPEALLSDFF